MAMGVSDFIVQKKGRKDTSYSDTDQQAHNERSHRTDLRIISSSTSFLVIGVQIRPSMTFISAPVFTTLACEYSRINCSTLGGFLDIS